MIDLETSELWQVNGGDDLEALFGIMYGLGFGAGLLGSGPLLIGALAVGGVILIYGT